MTASHAFAAMGTTWWVSAAGDLQEAERTVRAVEARLSRFLPDSALARLNRDRVAADPLLAEVVGAALHFRERTARAFDPTLGAALAAAGYDRPFALLDRPVAGPLPAHRVAVEVDGDVVRLHGEGELDLGGIAKGWTVDRVFDALDGPRLVDGGGDVRAAGEGWTIGVGDDGVVTLRGGALATSSTRVRRWRLPDGTEAHHILDPRTRRPACSALVQATVRAPSAATADVLATALIVDPGTVLALLPTFGAAALVQGRDGRWWTTPDWETPT